MVYGSRVPTGLFRKRPKIVLDKRFKFVDDINVGEKGQLIATLEVTDIDTDMDTDGNEMKITQLLITKSQLVDNKEARA